MFIKSIIGPEFVRIDTQKRFYTKEAIRGVRLSLLAEILPFIMIGWLRSLNKEKG